MPSKQPFEGEASSDFEQRPRVICKDEGVKCSRQRALESALTPTRKERTLDPSTGSESAFASNEPGVVGRRCSAGKVVVGSGSENETVLRLAGVERCEREGERERGGVAVGVWSTDVGVDAGSVATVNLGASSGWI